MVATRGVADLQIENREFASFVNDCFNRYAKCDWGDTRAEDWQSNDDAIKQGDRILAEYREPNHPNWRIWIITEWDRSVTTILFPGEY